MNSEYELKKTNEEIKKMFKDLQTFKDVADLLEIPAKILRAILIENRNNNYTNFKLNKKDGSQRTIYAPKKSLLCLQKRLSEVLNLNYNHHLHSHGFIKERSIITNATPHVKAKYVLNFDLENFFENITFARVQSMFMTYFKFNKIVSTTLANICCHHNGFLPQGGASSPLISNIIAFKLDKDFRRLARRYHCAYSRYADDITFSTKKNVFPSGLATFADSSSNPQVVDLSPEIKNIVTHSGFQINDSKTRLRHSNQHLEVTGITVNEKLNVPRTYIRRIRSILHSIEQNPEDISIAEIIFESKYPYRTLKGNKKPNMLNILRGMISHVGNVKGKEDPLYLKLGNRYNQIVKNHGKPFLKIPISKRELMELYTFVIESEHCEAGAGYFSTSQGTAFLLKGVGLVTNHHVLKEYVDALEYDWLPNKEYPIKITRSRYSTEVHFAKLIIWDKSKDIAILEIEDQKLRKKGFSFNEEISSNQEIEVVGYPDYTKDMELSVKQGQIIGERYSAVDREKRYEISAQVFGGNSGGPIIDIHSSQVLAIAVKGANGKDTVPNEVIPIKTVLDFARKKGIVES